MATVVVVVAMIVMVIVVEGMVRVVVMVMVVRKRMQLRRAVLEKSVITNNKLNGSRLTLTGQVDFSPVAPHSYSMECT